MGEWPPKNRFIYAETLWSGDLERFKGYDVPDEIVDGCLATVVLGITNTVYAMEDPVLAREAVQMMPGHREIVNYLLLHRGANMRVAMAKFGASDLGRVSRPEVIRLLRHGMRFLDIEEELDQ